MSIKAYGGIRFRARTLASLVLTIDQAFKHLEELARRHEAKFITGTAARAYDKVWHASLAGGPDPEPFARLASKAWRDLRERQRKVLATQERDPSVDSQIELQVWLGPANRLYGYVHTEVPGVREHLLKAGVADDFAYWNNSDRDDQVSAASWSRRAKVWKWLLSEEAPKSFQFVAQPGLPPSPDVLRATVPTRAKRAQDLAEQLVFIEWRKGQPPLPETGLADVSEIVAELYRFKDALRDDPFWKQQFSTQVEKLKATLPSLTLT